MLGKLHGRKKEDRGRVCFPFQAKKDMVALRTDVKFAKNFHKEHQSGTSSLLKITGFRGITKVPLDYMHLVLLGVVKRLIRL